MKINDIVFLVDDRQITKTKVIGVKDQLEQSRFDKEAKSKITRTYLVQINKTRGYDSESENWVEANDLYTSLDKAREVIAKRIEEEIIKEKSRISVVDLVGGSK